MAESPSWYYAHGSKSIGPLALSQLVARLDAASGMDTLVYGPGLSEWTEARHVGAIVQAAGSGTGPPPPPSAGARRSHEIDYEVFGEEMQYVEVTLDPGETVIAEAGAMMYMDPQIQMETVFGDPSAEGGGIMGKVFSAGKRLLTGESLFMTTFTAGGVRLAVSRASHPDAPR
jgi:hypothetical protein